MRKIDKDNTTTMHSTKIARKWINKFNSVIEDNFRKGLSGRIDACVYSLATIQLTEGKHGHKANKNDACVPVPWSLILRLFPSRKTAAKLVRVLEENGLIVKDRSYIAPGLAAELGLDPRCQMWHFTFPATAQDLVTVTWDTDLDVFAHLRKAIEEAEGKAVDAAHKFCGKWAIDDYDVGKLSPSEFYEVGRTALAVIRGPKTKFFRTFDAVALCKKSLRGKCFGDVLSGSGMVENLDITAAQHLTSCIGAALVGFGAFDENGLNHFRFADGTLKARAAAEMTGNAPDEYRRLYDQILADHPNTNIFGTSAKWTKSVRGKQKLASTIPLNNSLSDLADDHKTSQYFWIERRRKIRTSRNKMLAERSARLNCMTWEALRKTNQSGWMVAMAAKLNGRRDAYYLVHTLGEEAIMGTLIKYWAHKGITLHRVHDALWSADPRAQGPEFVRESWRVIHDICNQGPAYGRVGIRRLAKYAGITDADLDVVRDALRLDGDKAKEFSKICGDPNDYGYSVSVEDRAAKIA